MTTPMLPPVAAVTGTHAPEGTDLREAFSRALTRRPGGAQLVVTRRGEVLVDVAGGGMETDTPVQLFSVSKFVVALAAAHAHEAGAVDLDAPVASYWPAFDREATRTITARMMLAHSCGINGLDAPLSVDQLVAGELDAAVERQDPRWEPGTAHGYQAFTYGALLAGVFRHGVGTSIQEYAATHIVTPTGSGFTFGARDEATRARLAPLTFSAPVLTEAQAQGIAAGAALPDGAMAPIQADAPAFFGDPRVQGADWPAMSGVGTAGDVAAIANGALGHGPARTLSADSVTALAAEQSSGMDMSLGHLSRFGSGVELPHGFLPYFGGRSFGHQGAGGSVVAVEPETGTVLVYTSTHSDATVGGADQAIALLAATRQLLEG